MFGVRFDGLPETVGLLLKRYRHAVEFDSTDQSCGQEWLTRQSRCERASARQGTFDCCRSRQSPTRRRRESNGPCQRHFREAEIVP